jgi:O-antigen/teichoic acid export membrane protein
MLVAAGASILVAASKIDDFEWSLAEWQNVWLRHWHFSKWNVGTVFAAWMSGSLYYVIAGAILGSSAVGILNSAQTIMGVTNVFFQGMQNYMPIRASIALRDGGVTQLVKFLRKCSFLITSTTVGVALMVCIYPNYVMEFFYGHQFRDYGWVLVGYAIVYIVTALGQVLPIGLLTLEKTFPILLSFITSGIISVSIVYPLISRYGLTGVLIGLTVYPAIQSLVQFFAFRSLVAIEKARDNFRMASGSGGDTVDVAPTFDSG